MSSPITPDVQSKIEHWRKRGEVGELTLEELREAVALLRGGRLAAAQASSTAVRKRAIAAVPSADAMLDELDGL
jgi:hypothetical protein